MRFTQGSLEIARPGGVGLRLHWTLPIGLVLLAGLSSNPTRWVLALGLLICHLLGHAVVITVLRRRLSSLTLGGLGGRAAWRGGVGPIGRAAIAAGGVGAQLLVLAAALLWRSTGSAVADELQTMRNAALIVVNLLPFAPLDGAEAWRFPLLLGRRLRDRLERRAPDSLVDASDAAFDAGDRAAEVSALVSTMLEQAKREEP